MTHRWIPAVLPLLALLGGLAAAGEQGAKLSEPFAVASQAEGGLPQYHAQAAWSAHAKVWLVVWQQGDPTGDETANGGRSQDIYATRVDADGKVLDPKGIAVCAAKDFQGRPAVASDGKDFLVVWHDLRTGKDWDLYAARVSGEGKVLDADGFLVAGGAYNQCLPDLVFGGGSYYAAWLDMRHFPEYRVYGARVSASGKVLDAQGTEIIRLMSDAEREAWRTAPFSPGKYGTGWHDFGKKGMDGMRQPGPPRLATNGKRHLVIAHGGPPPSRGPVREVLRVVDAGTGRPQGGPVGLLTSKKYDTTALQRHHSYSPIVGVGKKGFLCAQYRYLHAFGSGGQALWLACSIGPDGRPVTEKQEKVTVARMRLVYADGIQRVVGYRTFGCRPNTVILASDGERVLYVSERQLQVVPKGGRLKADIDILGIIVDAEGHRYSDLAAGKVVEQDTYKSLGGTRFEIVGGVKVEPFKIAAGPDYQAAPAAAAGSEGSFLVVWQEEALGKGSRIMARLVRAK